MKEAPKGKQGHDAWLAATLPGDKVIAASYWPDGEHWIFDPWASRSGALNLHTHCHTIWARSILRNRREGGLDAPARFDWTGKTVYIVGRGESLGESAGALNRRGDDDIALFLNHSFLAEGVEYKPQDFVCCMDPATLQTIPSEEARGRRLIGCVTLPSEFVALPWAEKYGFTLWPKAPFNDLMREEFPQLPELNECLGISISAMHLAALNGAKKIVLVGQDYALEHGPHTVNLPDGPVQAEEYYMQLAQAVGLMAYFIYKHTGAKIVNCSRVRLAGFNIINPELGFMPWVEFDRLENVVSGARG